MKINPHDKNLNMPYRLYLKNGFIVNEGKVFKGNILIEDDKISDVFEGYVSDKSLDDFETIDLEGKYILPGIIDTHVHFREPGLIHKGDMASESRAAIAGGVTSIMEMPNTIPQTTSIKTLEEKIKIAENSCLTNYAFYIGATNDNLDELLSEDLSYVPGIKVFMGASTGNMLVDQSDSLSDIFGKAGKIIAVHCEEEEIVKQNLSNARSKFGNDIPMEMHPLIRSREACFTSTKKAVELALKHDTRLHILHLSTKEESELLENIPCNNSKQITGEACVHHLWFTDKDYPKLKASIKWNPAIKTAEDKLSLLKNINNSKIDIIATDHAPHTYDEKQQPYLSCPSGAPMIQHSLVVMLELFHQKHVSLETIVEKMCHNPARCFNISNRGFIRNGYYADLTIVDLNKSLKVEKSNILYKCGWSPLENSTFKSRVIHTFVNGKHMYDNGDFKQYQKGSLLRFS